MEDKLKNKVYKNMKAFASNIRSERESKNLTQKAVAEMLGVKTQSYQAYESGVSLPSAVNLLKLAHIFELSLDELFEIK